MWLNACATLSKWRSKQKKLGHQLDAIKADPPGGSHWNFTPRVRSAICGLWAEKGAVVERLRIDQYDQLIDTAPIDMFYGPDFFNNVPLLTPTMRLEVWFVGLHTELWIATKRIT